MFTGLRRWADKCPLPTPTVPHNKALRVQAETTVPCQGPDVASAAAAANVEAFEQALLVIFVVQALSVRWNWRRWWCWWWLVPWRARQLCPAAHRHLCSSSATPSWHNWRARALRRHSIRWALTAVRVWVGHRADHRRRTKSFEASQQLLQPRWLAARQISMLTRIIRSGRTPAPAPQSPVPPRPA